MKLTASQEQAVKHKGRNLQLIACAGSGKTEVVAQRVAHLLTQREDRLEPRNIVAFTFTEKAAAELKERIGQRTKDAGGNIVGMAEMYVGTIHGFCQELLQNEVPEYLKYEVLDEIRQRLYVNRSSSKTGLTTSTNLDGGKLKRWRDTSLYLQALNILREDDIDEQEMNDCSVAEGLRKYSAELTSDSYFDFSSMLEIAVNELADNLELRKRISERVKCVIVDEYQDMNPIQERLVRLLHNLGAGLCVVGDDDQTIYQWRGSAVKNMLKFEERYPIVKQITLAENFRSSEGIIATARRFVDKIEERLPKAMKFANAQPYETGDIVALRFYSKEDEANHIVESIQSLHGVAFNEGDDERGLSYSDMAVLLRSVKGSGSVITEALKGAGIPFIVKGLANLFETDEARAARDLFHYITDETIGVYKNWAWKNYNAPTEKELAQTWLNPRLGLSEHKVQSALKYAKEVRDTLHANDAENPPSIQAAFLKFLELAELREEKISGTLGQTVLFNLGRFSQVITDWESINFASKPLETYQGFVNFLYYQAEDAYSEGEEDNAYATLDAVQVMTVHQAKGREWPVVFLPALEKDRFPLRRIIQAKPNEVWDLIPSEAVANSARYDGSVEDERRLFYVAMTRSKKFLHMTCSPSHKGGWYRSPSIFWDDVLASKWVKRRKPNYSERSKAPAKPKASIANVEFSFTDLKYLFECGYQFKLRVLYGFNGPIAPPLGYGKSLHDALAEVHYRAMQGSSMSETDVPELVARHLRTPYAYGELRTRLEKAAYRDIRNYIRDNSDLFQCIEFSEQPVEVQLGDGVSIKGRIDLVRRTDTDETTIVDLKSNERSQEDDVTEDQLHTYALGYEELTGRDADFVEIYELRERNPKTRAVDDEFIDDVRKKTKEAATALRKMDLLPAPTALKCQRCDFSSLCSASSA